MEKFKLLNHVKDNNIDFSNYSKLYSTEFNFYYLGENNFENGFKVALLDTNSLIIAIISPIGRMNPRTKAVEIYRTIDNLLINLNLENKQRRFFLDLLFINGMSKDYLYEWHFQTNNSEIDDNICNIDNNLLDEEVNSVIRNYCNSKLSVFTNSSLNDKQKIEIAAYNIANNNFDEFTLENWMKYFRLFLNRFKHKKIS